VLRLAVGHHLAVAQDLIDYRDPDAADGGDAGADLEHLVVA